ncbi:Pyridoxine kinase [Alloiococcus otitis]|uniref:pyridoxal kinase n=1 Tax=Alloiococcus otitis ATCC 51267 TaxID=883081 RepID=K9EUU0_9LACT|nr:bifunctional hydroxymethylpyrimidine kinase/phosphomethylpyrimidine kinase [Alloiococcus otitis]EKU92940.1 phosphomethylpyrimidine kinase [Alloiococcus otitis ATCC 51267]SUU80451.1 Pyridoxine kinase [Alloiococcus otitis]
MSIDAKTTWTIAGNDASGGAGIAADLKTFAEYGTYGIASLTTVASMRPEDWKHIVSPIPLETLENQITTVLSKEDGVDAFKTGMIPNKEQIDLIEKIIKDHQLEDKFVLDPVMVCKGDDEVLNPELAIGLRDQLLPLAKIVTPNLFEAGQLADVDKPTTLDQMKESAKIIHDRGADYVVIKGGTDIEGDKATDLFYDGNEFTTFEADKIDNGANHGAGCTYAAAITAGYANGLSPLEAVKKAKDFVTDGIIYGLDYNKHVSPVFHSAHRLNQDN